MHALSRRLAAVALLVTALAAALVPVQADAHWRNYCKDGVKTKWANNSGVTYTYPSRWQGGKYEAAVKGAIANINTRVSGDWGIWPGGTASAIQYGSSTYGSAVARGFTRTTWNDSCNLLTADVRFNHSRVANYSHAALKAIAVHETGHAYGVGHFQGCDPDTMMVATWKCLWTKHKIHTMQPHDERDVRRTY